MFSRHSSRNTKLVVVFTSLAIFVGCGQEEIAKRKEAEAAQRLAEAEAAQARAEAAKAEAEAEVEVAKVKAEAASAKAKAEADDPVKKMKEAVDAIGKRRTLRIQHYTKDYGDEDHNNKWMKYEVFVASISYDVQQTDSLVSPLTAEITTEVGNRYYQNQNGVESVDSKDEALAITDSRTFDGTEKVTAYYALQDNRWVFKYLEKPNRLYNHQRTLGIAASPVERVASPTQFPFSQPEAPGTVNKHVYDGVLKSYTTTVEDE
jgi:hypothetical protein